MLCGFFQHKYYFLRISLLIIRQSQFPLGGMAWDLTGVYGPQHENEKMSFLAELLNIRNMMKHEWLILGDFNMIRREREKNKGSINRRVMRQFNHTIDYLQLLDLDLNGKLFTWTNEQDDPTMYRIDRFSDYGVA
jgi:hypothetical protein